MPSPLLNIGFSQVIKGAQYRVLFHPGLLGRSRNWQSIAKAPKPYCLNVE